MDLLGGYGSDGSEAEEEPVRNVSPATVRLAAPSAAPADNVDVVRKSTSFAASLPKPATVSSSMAPTDRKVVGPAPPPPGASSEEEDGEEGSSEPVGPARPPPPRVDEGEIPSISKPELWSKLPAPKTLRKVVTLQLPLNKVLINSKELDSDEDDAPARKRARPAPGSSKLMEFLPPPKNDLPMSGRGSLFVGAFGSGSASASSPQAGLRSASAGGSQQRGQLGASAKETKGASRGISGQMVGMTSEDFKVKHLDNDSDDEDPMSRFGAMPEAGAFASGPVADEGEEVEATGVGSAELRAERARAGPGLAPAPGGTTGFLQDGSVSAFAVNDPELQGPSMYINATGAQEHNTSSDGNGQQGYDAATASHYNAQHYQQYRAGVQQYSSTGDPGQDLFAHALKEEQERAAKKGKVEGMEGLLAGVQFKEVNAADLRYMDPVQREAAQNIRGALGVEYAAQLRSEARSHEGNRMAKRKHQIGTLFYNAKMKELEILEGKANSMRHKSETQAKYGW